LSARSLEKLSELQKNLLMNVGEEDNAGEIITSTLDVCDVNSIKKSFAELLEKFQKIDLVIFCSGLYEPMSVTDFNLDSAKKIIDVNLIGFLNLLHVITPQMLKQKSGHIATISSVAGYLGLPQSLAYGASKAALINLCEGIYPELQRHKIDLSVINPGFVKTRLTDQNTFQMPFLISSTEAANIIFHGLEKKSFEIHFPKKFTFILKFLRILPYQIFFFFTKKFLPKSTDSKNSNSSL
jgi:short-subunit dehydrogenase